MEGNPNKNNQVENSFDSFSGDGWDSYDDDADYEEPSNNNINQELLSNQKEDEIEIISSKYKKGYFKSFNNGFNKKFKNNYYDYNKSKNYNHRSYKDNKIPYYERNYRENGNNYYDKIYKDNKNSYYERHHYRNKNYYNHNRDNLVNKTLSYKKGNYNYKKEYNKDHLKIHVFEDIETPVFFNSKKQEDNEEKNIKSVEPKKNYILLENVLQLDKINDEILAKKNEQVQIVKEKISKNLEKEYGSLNINASLYFPKKKPMMMSENKPNLNLMNPQSQN